MIIDPKIYLSDNYLTLDCETDTSHGDYGHPVFPDNGMVLFSHRQNGKEMVSRFGDEFNQGAVVRAVQRADFIVAHNAKYELGWLRRCGLNLQDIVVFDTKIAEYVLLGNLAAGCNATGLPPRSTSLDACCRRRGWEIKDPVVDKMMKYGINPIQMPRPWLQGRCEQDVDTTERLFRDQLERLQKTDRLAILASRCSFTPVLADIEFQGMNLDKHRVEEVYETQRKRLVELEREMEEITGGINWRSPVQVANFLYDEEPAGLGFAELRNRDGSPKRTGSGKKLANKDTIGKLAAKTKRQKQFLALRAEVGKVGAALSKSLEFFSGVCDELDGVFYASFNQTVTATHRLSSSGHRTKFDKYEKEKTVQFQNMARDFKPLFTARGSGE